MKKYEVNIYVFGERVSFEIPAKDIDEASDKLNAMPVIDVLGKLTIGDISNSHSISLIK